MNWVRAHPYASALCAAGIMLAIGIFIVQKQSATLETPHTSYWEGANIPFLNPTSYEPAPSAAQNGEDITQQVKSGPPYTYIPPAVISDTGISVGQDSSFDFDAFIAMLSSAGGGSASGGQQTAEGNSLDSAYAFIPSGLMSTEVAQKTRTKTQQALYNYGNEVGSSIQSFEEQHVNTPQVLKDQVEDRTDPNKRAAVEGLARLLQNLGQSLMDMESVPLQIASAHGALAKSYIAVGTNLALVPKAATESDFVRAIETYNASADAFARNYIAVVQLFGAYGVTFSSNDAGSVFTFTPASL